MSTFNTSICVLALAGALAVHGQHTPLTSQYLFNGLLINPAYAGSRDALAANLTHRQQWVGFEGAPVTQTLSIHAPVGERKVGLGLLIYNDRIGVTRESGFFTSYAYRMRTGRGRLAMGLGAGASLLRANWQDVATQQQNDNAFAGATTTALRPDVSAGLYYYERDFFAGLSVPFLVQHRLGNTSDAPTLSRGRTEFQPMLTAGYLLKLSEAVKAKPSALLRYREASGAQGDLSLQFIVRDMVWLGASYRTNDAVIGLVEFLPNPQWRFGYAYDMGTSTLRRYHGGSHELMVQYEFGYRIRAKDPRYF